MYFVRLLAGAPKRMRDGRKLTDAVKEVRADRFTEFATLPAGLSVGVDHGVEVRAVANEAEGRKLAESIAKSAKAETEHAKQRRDRVLAKIAKQTEPAREANQRGLEAAAKLRKERAAAAEKLAKSEEKPAKVKGKGAGNRVG